MSKIVVIGEAFHDRYYIGTADRLSPEAPIPVVKVKEVIQLPGGAANVAANLKALNINVIEIYPKTIPTKNRLMAGTHQLARWDENDSTEAIDTIILKNYIDDIQSINGIVISDYNKGAINTKVIQTLHTLIPLNIPIFIDTKADPSKYNIFGGRPYFFPNIKEYYQYESYKYCKNIVRKEGPTGISLLDYDIVQLHQDSLATSVVSVNGAGDSAISGFVYSYYGTNTIMPEFAIPNHIYMASVVAAISISKPYTSTVTQDEINKFSPKRSSIHE